MNNSQGQEGEFNFIGYLKVIVKKRKLIISVILISVITAAVVSLFRPSTYVIDSKIRIGSISGLVISKNEVIYVLAKEEVLLAAIKKFNLDIDIDELKKMISVGDIIDTDFVELRLAYEDPDLGVKILNSAIESFILEGNERYKKKAALLEEQLQELMQRSKEVAIERDRINNDILNDKFRPDFPLLQNTITDYEAIYDSLRGRVYALRGQLENGRKFEVFEPPLKPRFPVSREMCNNVSMAAILGLLVSLVLAFVQEFWQKKREEILRSIKE